MFSDMFIGFIFGLVTGLVLSDLVWYLYVSREFYPLITYVEDAKQKCNCEEKE